MKKCRNLEYMKTAEPRKTRRLSDKEEAALPDQEYTDYLYNLRIKDERGIISWANKKQRLCVHFILNRALKLSDSLSGLKVRALNTGIPLEVVHKPVIFVVTHAGKYDISVFNQVVNRHFVVLSGDYESLHNNVEGLFTMLNGVVFFDMNSPTDRKTVIPRVIDMLRRGNDILCSMEAAWNISPNVLVTPLFKGMLLAAEKADAVIVPVGIERFNRNLYGVNVSSEVFDPKIELPSYGIDEALEKLRQKMAELKYETYYHPQILPKISISRKEIGDFEAYKRRFVEDILCEWTFTEEIVKSKGYNKTF